RARLAWSERGGAVRATTDRGSTTALTPLRALLVLETEQDYARFGLKLPDPAAVPTQAAEDTPPEKREVMGLDSNQGGALGSAAEGVLGGLIGNQIAEAYGVQGLGAMGTGSGG